MKQQVLAICGKDETYLYRLQNYFAEKKNLPFQVQIFTKLEELLSFCKRCLVEVLLVEQELFSKELYQLNIGQILILKENNCLNMEKEKSIDKLQSGEQILRQIIMYYGEANPVFSLQTDTKSKIMGIYSPIGRCYQTTFSLILGQLLAKKKKVLYFNFETYSGFQQLFQKQFRADLSDYLYILKNSKEKLIYRLVEMVESVNHLDFIPPGHSGIDLQKVPGEELRELIQLISRKGDYDYLILDLSDSLPEVFELLEQCDTVFTLVKEDGMAMAKMEQYEALLVQTEHEEVLEKTRKYKVPHFQSIPFSIEQLPYCEMADYIKHIIRMDLHEEL